MTLTRTIVVTDLVESTSHAAALGTEATAALGARHDRLARDLLADHGGREIDKSDGFLLLFDTATGAVAWAQAYHEALDALGVEARVGIHQGEVSLRENPIDDIARGAKPLEVEGVAKAVAARVMAVARGGQTLVTSSVAGALADAAQGVVSSHGHWQLQGLQKPMELWEVGRTEGSAPRPPHDAPKAWRVVWRNNVWLPVREVPHSLPAERDAFVGRADALACLASMLQEGGDRLVSILGIGGTGKTRLALHYAWTWLGAWPGGVWFCDLSEARSVEGVVSAVALGLDVPLSPQNPLAQLGYAIAGRGRCLVVLDNFEQVARHAEATLGHWLDRSVEARFVVTTREVLGLPGEASLPLAPLASDDAVALCDARARQAKPSYASDPFEVADLVDLLDRLPLAIELAAARVRTLSPARLAERIGDRFRLLASTGLEGVATQPSGRPWIGLGIC